MSELAGYHSDLMDRMVATACIQSGLAVQPLRNNAADARCELVDDIGALLDATLSQRLDIERIACEFGVSRRSPTRMIRELTGDSIVEYQSRQRVLHGATLLSLPGTIVVTAAAVVGVESPSYLARLFTRDGKPLPGTFKC